MRIPTRQRLSYRQARNTLCIAFILGTLFSMALITGNYYRVQNLVNEQVASLAGISVPPASRIAYNLDTDLALELVKGLTEFPLIKQAAIIEDSGNILAASQKDASTSPYTETIELLFNKTPQYSFELSVAHDPEENLGRLHLTIDMIPTGENFINDSLTLIMTVLIQSCVLALSLLVMFYFMLTKPLSSITNQLSSIRTKDDNSQLRIHPQPDHTDDEIGLLISTTNQQLSEIETNFHELKLAEKDRQRYTERLEQAVESRTRELTEANSELTSANQRLEFAKKEAEKSNKSRAKFLANMSHEIRTPLSGVLGMINLALDAQSGLDENIREQLELANTSGETLQQILNDILDISKVESGKINLEEVSFDLRESLEHIALLFKNSELATNVDIILDIAPDFPAEITGDPTRIKQIINNLVSNALKFTDQGYVIIEAVYLNFSESDSPFHSKHNIEIRIRDTGIGMSAAEKDRIFIPFTQANKQTTRRYGGTGLGLTLVKQLTECMNGTITVDSEEGLGSCFTLFFDFDIQSADHERFLTGLPSLNVLIDETDSNTESLNVELEILKKQINFWGGKLSLNSSRLSDHQHAYPTDQHYLTYDTTIADKLPQHKTIVIDSEDKESPYRQLTRPILAKPLKEALTAIYHLNSDNSQVDSTATAKKSDADHKYNHESILIVEDNVVNQKVATGLLKKLGFTDIEIAENGKIAIDLLNNKHFDLILMDCHMPVMDGYEATKAIRKNPNTQNIPIIAVTANILNEDKEKCFDSGMNDFLTKPYRKEDLSNKLDQWLL